ncbi:MAG: FAD-binding oxidoreductase [Rubrobacteraceae bacterium]
MQTKESHTQELRNMVGEDNVREATEMDAIDEVRPSLVVEPGGTEEISDILKFARNEGLAVSPRGGGTKMGWGNVPKSVDIILSTARMNEVIEHVPGDQIVRVQAGAKLAYVQQRLFRSNQMLALDPPPPGATVGGVVAANDSGPRRYKYQTARDLIIGITVVLADGTVAKAGGKVVKNVAGYDLGKLFTGSLGTLGVIAEANFRLHPLPEAARTVACEVESPEAAREAARAIIHSQVEATAVELHWDENEKLVSALLESISEGVEAKEELARVLLKPFGDVRSLEDDEYEHLGPFGRPSGENGEVAVKIGAFPAELAGVIEAVEGAARRKGVKARLTGHAATGVTFVGLSGEEENVVDVVEEMREIIVRKGGSVVVREAPASLKKRIEVWGPAGDYFELTRRMKEKFDPSGTINPGRFLGGI